MLFKLKSKQFVFVLFIYAIFNLQLKLTKAYTGSNYLSLTRIQKQRQHPSISLQFYNRQQVAENAKSQLQDHLQNFLEHLQRNLTTSNVFNTITAINHNSTMAGAVALKLRKILELSIYFQVAGLKVEKFVQRAEEFFEASKNESFVLWQKLRQVPSGHRVPPMYVKYQFTNYFLEMEYLHILNCELIDEVLEYTLDMLHAIRKTFQRYVDIQEELMQHQWHFNATDECCIRYMNFLQHWSAQIFKCAADATLKTVYDVYAVTEVNIRYVLQQMEFRIQSIFNCFSLSQYEPYCRFLEKPEADFEKLRAKLDELQVYFDVRAKHGLVSPNRHRHQRSQTNNNIIEEQEAIIANQKVLLLQDKCIPLGFPHMQMTTNLKSCFTLNQFN